MAKGVAAERLPEECPYTLEQILEDSVAGGSDAGLEQASPVPPLTASGA